MLPVEHRPRGTIDHSGWSFGLSLGSEYRSELLYRLQLLLGRPIVRLEDGVPDIVLLVFGDV